MREPGSGVRPGRAVVTAAATALILSVAPHAQSPAQSAPVARGSGVIVGKVLDGATNAGVGGAIVTLAGPTSRPQRVIVDAQGRFVFTELPAGVYTITSTRTGYLPGTYGTLRPDGLGRSLDLGDGERMLDALVRVWRYSTISGIVTDDAGDPVPYVRVQALKRTLVAGRWQLVNSNIGANTDENGAYRIPGLLPGEYAVVITSLASAIPQSLMMLADWIKRTPGPESGKVLAELNTNGTGGYANDLMQGFPTRRFGDLLLQSGAMSIREDGRSIETYPTVWYPAASIPGEAALIALGPGEDRTGIDLHPTLTRVYSVSGVITGPDGPMAHLVLRLVPSRLDETTAEITSSLSNSLTTSMTASDANGRFTFIAVPPGQYVVRAVTIPRNPPEVAQAGARPPPPLVSKEPVWWTATSVVVGQSDTEGVPVLLRRGLRLSGRVEFEGAAMKPTPQELRNIRVSMDPSDGHTVAYPQSYQAQIDPEGRFYTIGLMAGSYLLKVETPPRGWTIKSAIVNGRDILDTPLVLENDDVDGLVMTFTEKLSSIAGTVRGAAGRPDDEARVLIFPTSGAWTHLGTSPRRLRDARASRTGSFSITGVPPGEYFVIAVSDAVASHWQDPAFLQRLTRSATRVTIAGGQSPSLMLTTAQGIVR